VTEEIWQKLGRKQPLMTAGCADPDHLLQNAPLERRMELVFEAVRAVRDLRNRNGIPPKTPLGAVLSAKDEATRALLQAGAEIVKDQANVDALEIGASLAKPKLAGTVVGAAFTVYVPLEGKIDLQAEQERCRKEIEKTRGQAEQAEKQLSNGEFRKRKPEMAAEIQAKLEGLRAKIAELQAHLRDLGASA
jgi:valyl-tRNA synthetase